MFQAPISHFVFISLDGFFGGCLQYSPRKRHSSSFSEPPGLCSCHRHLYQCLFHPPNFREAIWEASGCPQLTSHLNSSVSSMCCLQKGNQSPNSHFYHHVYHQMNLRDLVAALFSVLSNSFHGEPSLKCPPESDSSSSWVPTAPDLFLKHVYSGECRRWVHVSPPLWTTWKEFRFYSSFFPLSCLVVYSFSNTNLNSFLKLNNNMFKVVYVDETQPHWYLLLTQGQEKQIHDKRDLWTDLLLVNC